MNDFPKSDFGAVMVCGCVFWLVGVAVSLAFVAACAWIIFKIAGVI